MTSFHVTKITVPNQNPRADRPREELSACVSDLASCVDPLSRVLTGNAVTSSVVLSRSVSEKICNVLLCGFGPKTKIIINSEQGEESLNSRQIVGKIISAILLFHKLTDESFSESDGALYKAKTLKASRYQWLSRRLDAFLLNPEKASLPEIKAHSELAKFFINVRDWKDKLVLPALPDGFDLGEFKEGRQVEGKKRSSGPQTKKRVFSENLTSANEFLEYFHSKRLFAPFDFQRKLVYPGNLDDKGLIRWVQGSDLRQLKGFLIEVIDLEIPTATRRARTLLGRLENLSRPKKS